MKPVRTDAVLGMTATTNAEFADRVYLWLGDDEGDKRSRMLADYFEVFQSTPKRWANGTAIPHPLLQSQIVRWIETQS